MSQDKMRRLIGEHTYNCLDLIIKGNNPTMPERVFRERWVQALYMRLESLDNKVGNVWVTEVAGNGRQPVDIINERGEVLFTVPGIYPTVATNKKVGRSLSDIMEEAKRLARSRYEREAEALKEKGLNKYYQPQKNNPDIAIWATIFTHYGLLQDNKQKSAVSSQDSGTSFEGAEDDF